jgi:predicted ATPase/DNA-binding winged helix-turn-helix (wHTH) protein
VSSLSQRLVLRTGTVDWATREVVRIDGRRLRLTPREIELLRYLARREGAVVPRDVLLTEVWGYTRQVVSRTVDTTVRRLRAKIEADPDAPEHLLTAHGSGYRLVTAPLPGVALPNVDSERLVGRGPELSALDQLLAEPGAVTLVGPPGVGKTRLALEAGRTRRETLVGGALFADLTAVGVQLAVAGSLGLAVAESAAALDRRLEHALSARGPTLLILDNCEGGLPQLRPVIERWCRAAPELRLLATSREPIGHDREHVFAVGPLPHEDAVQLFVELSRLNKPSFQLEEVAEAVDQLVERLDRLPLALALAASRSSVLSPRHLLERLDDRFRLLATRERGVPERHRTLRAALDVSWELLAEDERRALQALSVFRGGFDLDAAREVLRHDEPQALLERLCARSLLTRAPGRYGGFAFVWDYAAQRLAEDPEAELDALCRHVRCFAARRRPRKSDAARVVPDLANLVAATERALALHRARGEDWACCAARTCLSVQEVVERTGPYELGLEWTVQVLGLEGIPVEDRILLLLRRTTLEERLGGEALAPAREALALSEQAADPEWRVLAREGYGKALLDGGRAEEAQAALEQALDEARALGAAEGVSSVLGHLASANRRRGNLQRAREHLLEAIELAHAAESPTQLRYALGNLAMLDATCGRHAEAAAALQQVREECFKQQLLHGVLIATRGLASIAIETGHPQNAQEELLQAQKLAQRLGDPQLEIAVENGLGLVARMAGDWERALQHHRRALALAERLRARVWMTIERGNIGEMLLYLGRLEEAEPLLDGSLRELQEMDYRDPLATLRGVMAELRLAQGRDPEAEALLGLVWAVASSLRPQSQAELWVRQGLLQHARGQDAEPCLQKACELSRPGTETALHVSRLQARLSSGSPPGYDRHGR